MPSDLSSITKQPNLVADRDFLIKLPKTELHLHLEGTLEPKMMLELAQRNNISIPYRTIDEVIAAYDFDNLQSFLDIYYQCANVLQTEEDFYDLTWAYLLKCQEEGVVHTEPFFDPQTHTERGLDFGIAARGISNALKDGQNKLGISYGLILSFLRHLSEESAFECLAQAEPYLDLFIAVGLDSSELGNPPEKFQNVFAKAKELGLKRVAHAGEEGPAQYIENAITLLDVQRIDHGVRCTESEKLMIQLRNSAMPLTVCPLSNTRLKVYPDMSEHPILTLLDKGLMVMVNSDDPAFFGGYLLENYLALSKSLHMTRTQAVRLASNSINSSFLSDSDKQKHLLELARVIQD